MPHPYVTSATITGGKIALTVLVDDYQSGGYVEISGQATQTNGALANFYDIQEVPSKPNIPPDPTIPGDTDHYGVSVSAVPLSKNKFAKNLDVTAVMRVARVWLTVLREHNQILGAVDPPQDAGEGTTWDQVDAVSEVGGDW